MHSTRSIRKALALPTIPDGLNLEWRCTPARKDQGKAMTSSIPGLAESLDTRPKELRRKNGPALEAAEKEAELLLLRYLSRHSAGRVQLSLIYLTTHLSIVMR